MRKLYERGYEKDVAGIAKDVIKYDMYKIDSMVETFVADINFYIFSQNKFDVVLIINRYGGNNYHNKVYLYMITTCIGNVIYVSTL